MEDLATTRNSPATVEGLASGAVDSLHVAFEELPAFRQTPGQLRVESVSSELAADSCQRSGRRGRRRCKRRRRSLGGDLRQRLFSGVAGRRKIIMEARAVI